MLRFVFTNVVHASAESTYAVFGCPHLYQSLIPQHYPSVRVLSVRGTVSVAEEHINVGSREMIIMAKHVAQPPTLHETFVIGGDGKGSRIKHEFVQTTDDECTVTSSIDLKMSKIVTLFELFVNIRRDLSYRIKDGNGLVNQNPIHKKPSVQESFAQIMTDLAHAVESKRD